MTAETKTCQSYKASFEIVAEDFEFYKKIDVPPPTWCPECRLKRRLAWRGERTYHPDAKDIVYCQECYKAELI